MNRKEIQAKMKANNETIERLREENASLYEEDLLLCDDRQWFTEKMETVTERNGRKREKAQRLIGEVHWKEDFTDEDTGETITIERKRLVRVDGKWNY